MFSVSIMTPLCFFLKDIKKELEEQNDYLAAPPTPKSFHEGHDLTDRVTASEWFLRDASVY